MSPSFREPNQALHVPGKEAGRMRSRTAGGARACVWRSAVIPLLLLVAAVGQATAQVPRLDLAKWNQAYKLTVTGISPEVQNDYYLVPDGCNATGFDSDPAAAPLESCFYKQDENGTYSLWKKKPGDNRVNNNCYCYALNVFRSGFCIPGTGNFSLRDYMNAGRHLTCEILRQAVMSDGAREVAKDLALTTQPSTGHYIGIMVRSKGCNPYHCWQDDFHAVRKDANEHWSWKEPGGPASARDLFGNKIQDPESAVLPGHYHFCGYFWVNPAIMTINTNSGGGYTLANLADFYSRIPGVQAYLQPTSPYNHTVDGAFDTWSQKLIDEDLLWESKRGTPEWDAYYNTTQQDSGQVGSNKERSNTHRLYNLPLDSTSDVSPASSGGGSSSNSSAPTAPSNLNPAYHLYNLPITTGNTTGGASNNSSSTAGSGSPSGGISSQGTAAGGSSSAITATTPSTTVSSGASSSAGKSTSSNTVVVAAIAGTTSNGSGSRSSNTVANSNTRAAAATVSAAPKAGSSGGSSSSSSSTATLSSSVSVTNRFAAVSPPIARPAATSVAASKPKQPGSGTAAAAAATASSSSRSRKLLGSTEQRVL